MDFETLKDPFLQVLGECHALPDALAVLHSRSGRFSGRCEVVRGKGWVVGTLLGLGRFPKSSPDQPVSLTIERTSSEWMWSRDFGGHKTVSHIRLDAHTGWVKEEIGNIRIWLKPRFEAGMLHIDIKALSVFALPCPSFLLPRSASIEFADEEGRFAFDISARVPGLGLLIRYKGWLTPDHFFPAEC
ncbi:MULTISPECIES: DUF4166 domain-containing protein [unclassified Ruegeria]|uniref:DUF4166 domain-containing protein n=1 Tax=unclassified Ruegeria TaxID=2625375 RepID=UPI0014897DFA|nr:MULTISPECIES: DUF4166 domain-containing protein [unclassified Ruegeria]